MQIPKRSVRRDGFRHWPIGGVLRMKAKRAEAPGDGRDGFKLEEFLPYQLSVTASSVSRLFAKHYADRFGLSIPEWRVLAVVGRFGTASPSMVSEWAAM